MRARWVKLEVLWHRARRHHVVYGGNIVITRDLGGGGFAFTRAPYAECMTCEVRWDSDVVAAIKRGDMNARSFGFRR